MKSSLLKIITGLLFLCAGNFVMAQTASGIVDIETVKTVAKNYCLRTEKKYAKATAGEITLTLVDTRKSDEGVLYYIFDINYQGNEGLGDGYIIMSACYNQPPVIGYVAQGHYDAGRMALNPAFTDWLNTFADQIEYSLKNKTKDIKYQQLWGRYISKGKMDTETMELNFTSRWSQTSYYNNYSPVTGYDHHPSSESYSGNDRCLTGCVATAMGQIMYYYQWPDSISGSHEYKDPPNPNDNSKCDKADSSYDTLRFTEAKSINWRGMVDHPYDTNLSISRLLYNCAVSVDMDFAYCQSWTNTSKAATAYSNYFGYSPSAYYVVRAEYPTTWESMIINQIRKERPVQYRGEGDPGGHSFVCVGYKIIAGGNQFCFNLGWGNDNIWATLTDLQFSENQAAVIDIVPPVQPNLSVNTVSVASDPVRTRIPTSVSFKVSNTGTRNAGASTAALYLSTDQTLDNTDVPIGTAEIDPVPVNGTVNGYADIVADAETPGTYYILVEADTDHKVHESDETDNVTAVAVTVNVTPPASGEYQTKGSGNWTTPTIWERRVGNNWVPADTYPTSAVDKITIVNTCKVTVSSTLSLDQVTVMPGAEIDVSSGSTITIQNSPDDIDFEVYGKIVNSGTIIPTGKLHFSDGSVYEHARDGGTIPAATWDAASTCLVTGINSTSPTGFGQSFGNFTWQCPYQNDFYVPFNTDVLIKGNFTLNSGYITIIDGSTPTKTVTVQGNYLQAGGKLDFNISNNGAASHLAVAGNFTHTAAAGSMYVKGSSAYNGIIIFNGSAPQTLKFSIINGAQWVSYVVNSGSSVTLASNLGLTGDDRSSIVYADFTVNGTLDVGGYTISSSNAGSHFYLNQGATLITANTNSSGALAASASYGSILVQGSRTYNAGANYTFNGTANQYTGNGLPANITGTITVNNTGTSGNNTVTLNNPQVIANGGTVTIINGVFSTGTNLTMASTSNIRRSGGSLASTSLGTGSYNIFYTGNPLTTTSEISGSGLQNINIALDAGRTLTLSGTVTLKSDLTVTSGTLDVGTLALKRFSSGGVMSVADGATLKIGANNMPQSFNTHTFAGNSNVEYYGADQEIAPEVNTGYGNLTLSGTGTKTITAGSAVTVKSNLVTDNRLIIKSDTLTSNGSLIVKGTTTGTVTYIRQLSRRIFNNNQYISSPVVSNTDPNTDNVKKVYRYNEVLGSWESVTAGLTDLQSGIGYNLAQAKASDGLVAFTGTMADSYSIDATSPYGDEIDPGFSDYTHRKYADGTGHSGIVRSYDHNYGAGGWNMLGNPYTSSLSVSKFIAANKGSGTEQNNFDPNYQAVYIYDGSVPPRGKYYYIGQSDGWNTNVSADTNIQAGQGFFVLAMNDRSTFVFNRSMQVHNAATPMYKSTRGLNPWPGIELKVRSGSSDDATRVIFDDNMTMGLDPGFDIGQMSSGSAIEIYTSLVKDNGVHFSRQALPQHEADTLTIPVGINCKSGGAVTFSAKTVCLGHFKFYLSDIVTGNTTDLTEGSYTAVIPANTYGTGRFYLKTCYSDRRFDHPEKQPAENISGLRIWTSDGKVIIAGAVSADALFSLYDLSGRKVTETRLEDQDYNTVELPSGAGGIYVAVVKDGSRTLKSKIAVP